jgi:hypothetical protein
LEIRWQIVYRLCRLRRNWLLENTSPTLKPKRKRSPSAPFINGFA